MKAWLSLSFVTLVLGGIATIACSSSDSKGSAICQDDSECQADGNDSGGGKSKSKTSNDDDSEDTSSGPSGKPKPGDASADVGKPDASDPPSDQDCIDLEACCDGLDDFGDALACVGLAMAADPEQCASAKTECKAGGGTLGQIFATNHPKCSQLATCCTKFHDDGYDTTAQDCQEWVETAEETQCEQTLSTYQDYGECF